MKVIIYKISILLILTNIPENLFSQSWQWSTSFDFKLFNDINIACNGISRNNYAAVIKYDTTGLYSNIAIWNGNQWSILGGETPLNSKFQITAMFCDKKQNIYVGISPSFDTTNAYVAKWNGKIWSELKGKKGIIDYGQEHEIKTLYVDDTGNVYAGGNFRNSKDVIYVAKWNEFDWIELGGLNSFPAYFCYSQIECRNSISQITSNDKGVIFVSGAFANTYPMTQFIAKYENMRWSELAIPCGEFSGDTIIEDVKYWYTFDINNGIKSTYINEKLKKKRAGDYICVDNSGSIYTTPINDYRLSDALEDTYSSRYYFDNEYREHLHGQTVDTPRFRISKWDGTTWNDIIDKKAQLDIYHQSEGYQVRGICTDGIGTVYVILNPNFTDNLALSPIICKWDGKDWSMLGGRHSLDSICIDGNNMKGLYSCFVDNQKRFNAIVAGTGKIITFK